MDDRTVHASGRQMEVVRYDRAGKWYVEPKIHGLPRQAVTLKGAVDYTMWLWANGGTPHMGRPGGNRFDTEIRKRCAATRQEET